MTYFSHLIIGTILTVFILNKANSAVLRDPTQPSFLNNSLNKEPVHSELTAIFFERNRRLAVIDGKILGVGDEINGRKVVAIQPNYVNLQGINENITLFLFNQTVVHHKSKE